MIQADPLCGHFPKKTKAAGRHGPILKKEVTMTGILRFGMIRRTSRPEESNTSSKQLTKEVTMYGYYDSG